MRYLLILLLAGCGRAQFSGDSDHLASTSVPIVASATDYYIEIGENFANQIEGDVDLTNVQFYSQATWPGISTMQFEMRASLTGAAPSGSATVSLSAPSGWASGVPVLNSTLPAHASSYQLMSGNLKDSAQSFLKAGQFWIIVRVRYTGLDLTHDLTLTDLFVHADGEKSLSAFAPVLNLGF